jgi:quercetin dioxygenase-like cupin family protein
VIPAPEAFVNDAGTIRNIAFGEFRCVSIIESRAGAWRSNHYHRTDAHLLYVLSGKMIYWECAIGSEYPADPLVLEAGDSVFTHPLRAHKTYFPVDSVLISCSKNPRDHESHEADVVRVSK